jgi:predicted RNA-binding protein with PUA-like domain
LKRWLVKTDPDTYAYADLVREGATRWEGVKNALALRHLRAMAKDDPVLVYETGGVKAIVGTAFVQKGPYLHEGASVVDLRVGKPFLRPVTLAEVRGDRFFNDFSLVRMGRLSVIPVSEEQWRRLAESPA